MKRKLFFLSLFVTVVNFAHNNISKNLIPLNADLAEPEYSTRFKEDKKMFDLISFYETKRKVITELDENGYFPFLSKDKKIPKLEIYPNPFNNSFTIELDNDSKIEIYNLLGEIVKTKNVTKGSSQFDMTNFSSGVYFLKVTNDMNISKIIKIVKQ